jgi:hypothetical protein
MLHGPRVILAVTATHGSGPIIQGVYFGSLKLQFHFSRYALICDNFSSYTDTSNARNLGRRPRALKVVALPEPTFQAPHGITMPKKMHVVQVRSYLLG